MKQTELIFTAGAGLACIWAIRKFRSFAFSKATQNAEESTDQNSCAKVEWASVSLASTRLGHGFNCHVKGEVMKPVEAKSVFLNIWGDFAKGLPIVASTVAEMLLPFRLKFIDASCFKEKGKFELDFGLGLYRLSHPTLMSTLDDQVANGDPVLLFEMIAETEDGENVVLCEIHFKCSDFKRALEFSGNVQDRPDITHRGFVPYIEKVRDTLFSRMWNWFSWVSLPVAFNGFIWYIHQNLNLAKDLCFQIISTHKLIKNVLPPIPTNMGEAWLLGQLQGQMDSLTDASKIAELLQKAADTLGRASLSKEEFMTIYENILQHEISIGVTSRVWGFFNFVNIMWLLAIAGITISVGPAIWHLTEPIRRLLKRIAEWVYDNIIVPTTRFCHENYVFEVGTYFVCLNFILEGMCLPAESGTFVSLTGYLLTTLAMSYTTLLRGGRVFYKLSAEVKSQLSGVYFALLFIPGAIYFQSQLMGWAAVSCIYMALGFNVQCRGLCWCFGWNDKDAVCRSVAASILMMFYFIQNKIVLGHPPAHLAPFASACTIFGSIIAKLGMLILSSKWNYPREDYTKNNLMMVSLLLASSAIGNIYGLNGLANTSTTFIVIYTMEKYVEWYIEMKWNGWVLMLSLSSFMYKIALWLHQNPEFVASLFNHTSKAPVKNVSTILKQISPI